MDLKFNETVRNLFYVSYSAGLNMTGFIDSSFVSLIFRLTLVTCVASLRSFGILLSVDAVQEEFLDSLTLKDGTDRSSRNVSTTVQFYAA